MNVRFTGRHLDIVEADRVYAREKLENLARFHRRLDEVECRVGMDGGILERVELEALIGGAGRAVAVEEGEHFRDVFDAALKGLRRQLLREKESRVDRRRRGTPPIGGSGGPARWNRGRGAAAP